jgi:protein TonB
MPLRFPAALVLAAGVTLALFWAMQALVGVSGELQEGTEPLSVDFVRLRRDTTPERKKREPPKREKPEQPPPPPDISLSKASLDPGGAIGALAPALDPSEGLSGGIVGAAGADRDAVPLVRIEPEYPQRARQRSIQGWVTLQFTISAVGSVKDAVVVASRPPRVFDRNALQAVRKWKYNPKIENGAAVERHGIRVTLDFSMEN